MNRTLTTPHGTVITYDDGYDPHRGARLGPAWDQIMNIVADNQWHQWRDIVAAIHPGSDLKEKTISGLIHQAVRHGRCQRRGRYSPNPARDTRAVRLTPDKD